MRVCYLLLASLAAIGCARDDPPMPSNAGWSDGDALAMLLEVERSPTSDLRETRLKLTVKNVGKKAIVLDRELQVGFALRCEESRDEDAPLQVQGRVRSSEIAKLPRPAAKAAEKRFVTVSPASTLTRIFDLSQPVRTFQQGHATDMDRVHHGFFYEADTVYEIPADVKKLSVEVFYGGVWPMAGGAFRDWFNIDSGEIGLCRAHLTSNAVVVERPK